jgi:branched-chain amino acid transport system substrate-binding protein
MSYATDGASIIEALSTQGFTGKMIGADGVADAKFTDAFTDVTAVNGLIATRPRPGEDTNAKTAFESAYAAAGGADGAIYTGETYDAIKIIAASIISDPENILTSLKKTGTNYVGASGTHTFDANGDVAGTGYEVCQFDGTAFSCPRTWTSDDGIK